MDPPHVYESPGDCQLQLGEVLSNVHQLVQDEQQIAKARAISHPFAVILSQDCDLEWDYRNRQSGGPETSPKNLPNVLFCEVAEATILKTQSDLKSDQWKRVRQNKDERYQFLEECPRDVDGESVGLPDLAIDFKRYFTVPTRDVYSQLNLQAKRRACLKQPYAAQLSTRFYYFQVRIALPREHGQVFPTFLQLAKDLHYRF